MESQTATRSRTITYYINGKAQTTQERELTVRAILEHGSFVPPEQYRLIRDAGNKKFDSLDEEVKLHENERLTAIFEGPTPVS